MPGPERACKASGRRADLSTVEVPFKISVMLWTVLTELPFEERLEKVAEAGYHAVELVGEYSNGRKMIFADTTRNAPSWA